MRTLVRNRLLTAFTLAAPLFAGACNTELQGQADVLLDALASDDYAKFQSIAASELIADVSEAHFLDIAATYDELGALNDKTRTGLEWRNDTRVVSYTLEHENGDLHLTVTSHSDKLDSFELEGAAWKKASLTHHRHGLEALLAAVESGDHSVARTLVHGSISDEQIDALLKGVGPHGKHTKLELSDDTIPEFRVEFGDVHFFASVRMSGKKIIGFGFRPIS